ncbi:MAG: 3-oxoacyl-ACP synthase [Actinobacteria bacterium]|nr:MAG: 3-oxoacyl-ACP synthase [Actinomycetota bacterium]
MTASPLPALPNLGVTIAGVGSAVPGRVLSNKDLEDVMETSDEWIAQRTGIRERRVHTPGNETNASLGADALRAAMADANTDATELDLVITATMTADMPTPSASCLITHSIGAGNIGAFDLNAACSGFVFGINVAHGMIRNGMARTIGLVGVDIVTKFLDYSTFGRGASILFGDAAGAVILKVTDDTSKGLIAQAMHSDGGGSKHLFVPTCTADFFNRDDADERKLCKVQMNGQAVFRFAVTKFPMLIAETLEKASLSSDDVDHYICHQSNMRILTAARERFGLPEEKLHINVDRFGNTVAASVPLVLDELTKAGRIHEGQKVMFLGFGAGLTWGSSLWQL